MNYKKLILASGLAAIIFVSSAPVGVLAQGATDSIPPVPVSDSALRSKEVGITVLGYTVPKISLDSIMIAVVKQIIGKMVDSTVNWIRTGFEGNPAYVTDPKQFFTNVADVIAGDFIAGSDLNFLCSPFQTQVRLSLLQKYKQPQRYQCTATQILNNATNFYNDFSQGGWDSWLTMTQINSNTPYGAYLEAELELNSRIATELGLQNKQLSWNSGFLSWSKCLEFVEGSNECKPGKRGPVQTPGKVINDQLTDVLGSGLAQLELADEFDEVVGALIGVLIEKLVFDSGGGLFNEPYSVGNDQFTPVINIPPDPNDPVVPAVVSYEGIFGASIDESGAGDIAIADNIIVREQRIWIPAGGRSISFKIPLTTRVMGLAFIVRDDGPDPHKFKDFSFSTTPGDFNATPNKTSRRDGLVGIINDPNFNVINFIPGKTYFFNIRFTSGESGYTNLTTQYYSHDGSPI